MPMVRVWNDNIFQHEEKFKGKMVFIPAGGFVEMESDDAVLFKSQFKAPIPTKSGRDDPKGFKKIRIDFDPGKPVVQDVVTNKKMDLICNACGFESASTAGLSAHVRAKHAHQMLDDDAREALLKGG